MEEGSSSLSSVSHERNSFGSDSAVAEADKNETMNVDEEIEKATRNGDDSVSDSSKPCEIEEGRRVPEPKSGSKRSRLDVDVQEKADEEAFAGRVLRPRKNSVMQKKGNSLSLVKKQSDSKRAVIHKARTEAAERKERRSKLGMETNSLIVSKRAKKESVRLKIIDMLLTAGWRIEYRPRNGRNYRDAIYVSPRGRGCWSVTLAYRVLQKECETISQKPEDPDEDFVFVPLPEEDIKILMKIMRKKRRVKGVKTGGDGRSEKKHTKTMMMMKKKKLFMKKHDDRERRTQEKKPVVFMTYRRRNRRDRVKEYFLRPNRNQDNKEFNESDTDTHTIITGKEKPIRGTERRRSGCTLLVRTTDGDASSEIGNHVPYPWKRTVLNWMIDLNVVPLNGKVGLAVAPADRPTEGSIERDGIRCGCCDTLISVSDFENHAGGVIVLENGRSFLDCQFDSWNEFMKGDGEAFSVVKVDADDPNDDTCGACGDGGDLICCDSCPSTFHQRCGDLQALPSDDWHCTYCVCTICRGFDVGLLSCHACSKKYHRSCVDSDGPDRESPSFSFCSGSCEEIHESVEALIGVKNEMSGGFSWSFVRRHSVAPDSTSPRDVNCNSKIAVSLAVMDECFIPIVDERSGIDVIRNIVCNRSSNFTRLDYSGFLTAVLEKDDEVVSVASVRIHGRRLAEMPFIGTRQAYRRHGMCRRLLGCIESALAGLRVEKLIIPAIPELLETWIRVFGFRPLAASTAAEMRQASMLIFPGTDMLQKVMVMENDGSAPGECGRKESESTVSGCCVSGQTVDGNSSSCSESANSGRFQVVARNMQSSVTPPRAAPPGVCESNSFVSVKIHFS